MGLIRQVIPEGEGPMQGSQTANRENEAIDSSISEIDWKTEYHALMTERNALILERDVLSNQCHALLSRRVELERELLETKAELERVGTGSTWLIGQTWDGLVARFPRVLRREA